MKKNVSPPPPTPWVLATPLDLWILDNLDGHKGDIYCLPLQDFHYNARISCVRYQ